MKRSTTRARDLVTALAASGLTILAVAGGGFAEPTRSQAAPRNEQAPTISGTRRVGSTLTVNPGAWSGPQPITFSYVWVRCNSQLANCRNTGRTARTYALGNADLGRRLVVVVTARNRDGATNASANTGVIQQRATAPRNTAPPSVSGNAREGDVLTANPGSWEGTQPMSFTYQWERCDANGGNCAAISGATARTYGATSADVGRSVRVVVRARNDGGSRTATSSPTTAVAPGGPGGQIRLPSGKISVPIESVSLPSRLIIDAVAFSPNPVRSRSATIAIRVHVVDTRGFVIRGSLVYARSTPLLTTTAPETATGLDGWATLRVRPRAPRAGLVFPLRRGVNVQFYVQARRAGERLQYGVTATRLVQVRTAG
jgi:Ig domain of plant-specific actin-binding protein